MQKTLLAALFGSALLAASCGSTSHGRAEVSSAEVATAPEVTLVLTGMT